MNNLLVVDHVDVIYTVVGNVRLTINSNSIGLNVGPDVAQIKIASWVFRVWYWYSTWMVAYNQIFVDNVDHYSTR